jgi:3-hydroxyisobutyrate dehydrogenase-like beta-hydroxyacid dehydrogenase
MVMSHCFSEPQMQISTIGLMTPGDMGQALAMQIQAHGYRVCTALEGRSERSRALAKQAGLTDLGTLARLVDECYVMLSVMNPGAALDFARQAADAIANSARAPLFLDCNAIAPETVAQIAALIEAAGGRFLDAGIIGPPPRGTAKTNLYVSGPGAADVLQLASPQLTVQVVSDRVGDASALKMCFGALNKGTQALWLEVLIAARRLGVDAVLERQLRQSRGDLYDWALSQFPALPPKAYRWVPEISRSRRRSTARASRRACSRARRISMRSLRRQSSAKKRLRIAIRAVPASRWSRCWRKSAIANLDRISI